MYVIVEFIDEGVVDMAPKCWLQPSSTCFWPPKSVKSYEVTTYVKQLRSADEMWPKFAVRILGYADTFQEARIKTKRAESCSELTTDTEDYGRGRSRKVSRKRPIYESSDEDEENYSSKITKLLPPRVPDDECHQEFLAQTQTSIPMYQVSSPKPSCSFNSEVASPLQMPSPRSQRPSQMGYLRPVLQELAVIRTTLASHSIILEQLLNKLNNEASVSKSEKEKPLDVNFPATCEEEFIKIESYAMTPSGEAYLLNKFKAMGGTSSADHTRRIMKHIMTDAIAEEYSWCGTNKKRLSSLKIAEIVIDGVMALESGGGGRITRAAIEDVIKNWLRHAKERKLYASKKISNK